MNQRKALFWATYSDWAPVASIERELVLLEKESGSLCIGIHCDGALQRCHAMRRNQLDRSLCIGCQESYLKNIVPLLDRVYYLKPQKLSAKLTSYDNHEALRQAKYRNIDVGRAVLSTVKVDYGDNDVPLDGIQKSVEERIEAALAVLNQFEKLLTDLSPDAVYMFNGRQFDSRPLLRLCQQRSIEYYTYEAVPSKNHYGIYKNSTPHSLPNLQGLFSNYLLGNVAKADFGPLIKRINNQDDIYDHKFRVGQRSALLPENFDTSKTNIVILHSSEDEYEDVDNSINIWGSNSFYDYLSQLKEAYKNESKVFIYVRIHPRLKHFKPVSEKRLSSLGGQNLVIISSASSIDTFSLASSADVCLCYGSTAGPEAVLLGAKVVCIGECGYSSAGLMPNAHSINDLKRIIENPSTIRCNQQLSAKYIAFLTSKGEPFLLSDSIAKMNHGRFVKLINKLKHILLRARIPMRKLGVNSILYRCWRCYSMLSRRCIPKRLNPRFYR